MSNDLMAAYLQKVVKASVNKSGNYVRGGTYLFEVQNILFEKKEAGMCWIVELITREAQQTATSIESGEPIKPHALGEVASEIQNLDGAGKQSAPGNIKGFVCALLGADPNTVSEQELMEAIQGATVDGQRQPGLIEKAQPARGMLIRCVAFEKLTKVNKKPFTVKNWSTVQQTPEEIQARRHAQDTAAKAA